jgi:AcrR family transcriptional regulator
VSARVETAGKHVSHGERQGGQVAELQRRRLLSAVIELVSERGVQAVNVAVIAQRAGVSRKTFYDIFRDREACLLAAFEATVERISQIVLLAAAGERKWRDRVRVGLTALLRQFDDEPAAGRLVVVEALSAGEPTLAARRLVLDRLIAIVDEGRAETKRGREPPPLTAEGVVGAVFSVIHARMLDRSTPTVADLGAEQVDPSPLSELTRALTAIVVQPYLGTIAAHKEIEAPPCTPMPMSDSGAQVPLTVVDPFKDLPIRLTYRTALVLGAIAESPGASSKQVALVAGVSDQGQMSRLLARLQRFGLVENTGGQPARGEAKAWMLTDRGVGVFRAVADA